MPCGLDLVCRRTEFSVPCGPIPAVAAHPCALSPSGAAITGLVSTSCQPPRRSDVCQPPCRSHFWQPGLRRPSKRTKRTPGAPSSVFHSAPIFGSCDRPRRKAPAAYVRGARCGVWQGGARCGMWQGGARCGMWQGGARCGVWQGGAGWRHMWQVRRAACVKCIPLHGHLMGTTSCIPHLHPPFPLPPTPAPGSPVAPSACPPPRACGSWACLSPPRRAPRACEAAT